MENTSNLSPMADEHERSVGAREEERAHFTIGLTIMQLSLFFGNKRLGCAPTGSTFHFTPSGGFWPTFYHSACRGSNSWLTMTTHTIHSFELDFGDLENKFRQPNLI
jgi:hypothetical protein